MVVGGIVTLLIATVAVASFARGGDDSGRAWFASVAAVFGVVATIVAGAQSAGRMGPLPGQVRRVDEISDDDAY